MEGRPVVPILPGAADNWLWVVPGRLNLVVSAIPCAAVRTSGIAVLPLSITATDPANGGRALGILTWDLWP
jgi:hypothetical protein